MQLGTLAQTYDDTPVGYDNWVTPEPDQSLEDFQTVVNAAEAWQAIRQIEIIESRRTISSQGYSLVKAFKFQRLR